jgi:hypothetical protein
MVATNCDQRIIPWFDFVQSGIGARTGRGTDYGQFAPQHIVELRELINAGAR